MQGFLQYLYCTIRIRGKNNYSFIKQFFYVQYLQRKIYKMIKMTQDQYLNYLFKTIYSRYIFTVIVDVCIFKNLQEQVGNNIYSQNGKQELITQLQKYIQLASSKFNIKFINPINYAELEKIGIQMGHKIKKVYNQQLLRNKWIQFSLQFVDTYSSYTFSLANHQQRKKMTQEVKYLCSMEQASIFYLSGYLIRCCQNEQKNGRNVEQIIRSLSVIVDQLKKYYSPLGSNRRLQAYLKMCKQQQQLDKVQSLSIYSAQKFQLKGNKQKAIQNEILEMINLAKINKEIFRSIVYDSCIKNGGFGLKVNLKLQSLKNKSSLHRVKEKLFKNQINTIEKQQSVMQQFKNELSTCSTISQRLKMQKGQMKKMMQNIYQRLNSLSFTVTDILRGKCMFNRVSDINKTYLAIVQKIEELRRQQKDVQIAEIDNRLRRITRDLVIKIKIGRIVCQFQMALYFDHIQNQIHHKMYELSRSKIKSSLTLLYQWNQKAVKRYMKLVTQHIQMRKIDSHYVNQCIIKLDRLNQLINLLPREEQQKQQQKSVNITQIYHVISRQTHLIKITEGLINKRIHNTLDYFIQRQNYQALQNYVKQNRLDSSIQPSILQKIGIAMWGLNKIDEACRYLLISNQTNRIQTEQFIDKHLILASAMRKKQEFAKCHQAYQFILRYCSKFQNQNLSLLGKIKLQIGILHLKIKNFKEALKWFMQAEQNYKQWDIYNNIGSCYLELGIYQQSFNNFKISLSLVQQNTIQLASILNNIGSLYQHLGKQIAAISYYTLSMIIIQTLKQVNCIENAEIMNNIGTAYHQLNKNSLSNSFFLQSLSAYENSNCQNRLDFAIILSNTGQSYKKLGNYQLAMNFLQESACIIRNTIGEQNITFAIVLNNIGDIFFTKRWLNLALQTYKQVLEIKQRNQIQDLAITLNNIAVIYFYMEKYDDSLKFFKNSLQINKDIKGQNHISCAKFHIQIGKVYKKLKNYQQCKYHLSSAEQILKKNVGEYSKEYIQILQKKLQLQRDYYNDLIVEKQELQQKIRTQKIRTLNLLLR